MSVVEEILAFCDKHNERLREFDELKQKNQHTPIYWRVLLWLLFIGVFGGFIANFYLVEDRSSQLLNAGIIIGSAVLIFAIIYGRSERKYCTSSECARSFNTDSFYWRDKLMIIRFHCD